jgi:hypothetical protein
MHYTYHLHEKYIWVAGFLGCSWIHIQNLLLSPSLSDPSLSVRVGDAVGVLGEF